MGYLPPLSVLGQRCSDLLRHPVPRRPERGGRRGSGHRPLPGRHVPSPAAETQRMFEEIAPGRYRGPDAISVWVLEHSGPSGPDVMRTKTFRAADRHPRGTGGLSLRPIHQWFRSTTDRGCYLGSPPLVCRPCVQAWLRCQLRNPHALPRGGWAAGQGIDDRGATCKHAFVSVPGPPVTSKLASP